MSFCCITLTHPKREFYKEFIDRSTICIYIYKQCISRTHEDHLHRTHVTITVILLLIITSTHHYPPAPPASTEQPKFSSAPKQRNCPLRGFHETPKPPKKLRHFMAQGEDSWDMITCPKLIKLFFGKKASFTATILISWSSKWILILDGWWYFTKVDISLSLGGEKLPPCPKKSTTFEALFAVTVINLINLIIYLHHQPKSNKHVCVIFSPKKNP